jgi:prepilin-type N-terminal cleavage/methylation domain-containing protein
VKTTHVAPKHFHTSAWYMPPMLPTMNRSHAVQRGFTLIEMLVVVGIIATLAGLLLPAVGLVKRMANDIKCGNNLQQIGAAIEVYKFDNNDVFPSHLIGGLGTTENSTNDLVHADGPLKGLAKIFICPRDSQSGKDPQMGRGSAFSDLSYMYDSGPIYGKTVGSSYLFEANGYQLQPSQYKWFYTKVDYDNFSAANAPTWAVAKFNQLKNGSPDEYGVVYSGSFAPSQFPIIRCFWHHQWNSSNAKFTKKVKNVSWELNVFDSSPFWEHDANPLIIAK